MSLFIIIIKKEKEKKSKIKIMGLIKLENRVELSFCHSPYPQYFLCGTHGPVVSIHPICNASNIYIGSCFLFSEKFPIHVMKEEVRFHVIRTLAYKNLFLTQTTP